MDDLYKAIGQKNMELEWLKKRLAALSRPDRINLIERDNHEISLTKQAELLNISRSGLYYRKIINPENIKIRHAIDEIFANTRFRFSQNERRIGKLSDFHLPRQDQKSYAANGIGGRISKKKAEFKPAGRRMQNLSVSSEEHGNIPSQSSLGTDITYVRMERDFAIWSR